MDQATEEDLVMNLMQLVAGIGGVMVGMIGDMG